MRKLLLFCLLLSLAGCSSAEPELEPADETEWTTPEGGGEPTLNEEGP